MVMRGAERARRVITRSPTRTVGRFPSLKGNCMIHWESQLERDFVYLLEFDRAVLARHCLAADLSGHLDEASLIRLPGEV